MTNKHLCNYHRGEKTGTFLASSKLPAHVPLHNPNSLRLEVGGDHFLTFVYGLITYACTPKLLIFSFVYF